MVSSGKRILLINDDLEISRHIEEKLVLEAGYLVDFEYSVEGGMSVLKECNFDLVIVKLGMQDLDAAFLVKEIKSIDPECIILALLDDKGSPIPKNLSGFEVYETVAVPINFEKLLFVVKKGFQLRSSALAYKKQLQSSNEHSVSLQKQNVLLTRRMEESAKSLTRLYEDLRSTYMHTIRALAQAIDARDHYTHSHSKSVAGYAVAIAEEMSLSTRDIEVIREAGEMHDLGKIGITDNILSKPASLTSEEWEEIKTHPGKGAEILKPLTFLNEVIQLVKQHHENYDGTGYPQGKKAEEIPLGARIIHLADAYEAMRSARSYRKIPMTKDEAAAEIKKHSGTQFDPKVVDVFLRIVDNL